MPVHVSAVFVFQVFRILKVPNKFPENQIKNQRVGSFRNHEVGASGDPPGPQAPWWRDHGWGRAQGALGPLVAPLAAPFRLYLPPVQKPSTPEALFPISSLFRRRRRFKIGAARRGCPGTLPEGGFTSGSPSISMDASRMCHE